ncbi:MAG: flavodoxin domain-containing protein [candidate division FCPU426 bacterium]
MANVLVTYATRYGSTREVAESVASVLRENGLQVSVESAAKVKKLDGFSAVVLGAPLYIGKLQKDAGRFLERQGAALASKPLAIFTLGPVKSEDLAKPGVLAQMQKALEAFPGLKPLSTVMFGGKYDPATLRFPDSLLGKLPVSPLYKTPASDARDWKAIKDWAQGLAKKLKAA